jgi:hypothetical protein
MTPPNIPFLIFKFCTHHMCSTRVLGISRVLLGLTLILFPYPTLTFHATWVWSLWLLYYLASVFVLLGVKPTASLAALFSLLCYGLYSTASQDGVLAQQAQFLAIYTLCLSATPSAISFSLPNYIKQYRGERRPRERGNLWAFRLIQIQTCSVLLFNVWSHFSQGLFTGDRIEQLILHNLNHSDPLPLMQLSQFTSGIGVLMIIIPCLAALFLWTSRTWLAGMGLVILYGLLLQILLPDTLWFLLLTLGGLSFLDPVWLHRIPAALYDNN